VIGVEILTGLMFLVFVHDRTANTLFNIMKKYIRKGSIITVGTVFQYKLRRH